MYKWIASIAALGIVGGALLVLNPTVHGEGAVCPVSGAGEISNPAECTVKKADCDEKKDRNPKGDCEKKSDCSDKDNPSKSGKKGDC